MKYLRIVLITLLLALAAFIRYGSSLDAENIPGRHTLAYQVIGSGGDPDYQLYCARTYYQGQLEALTHYDYFFLCPAMAALLESFTFVEALDVMTYIIIGIGVVAVVTPYLLFTLLYKYEFGGLVASLVILVNPVMINNADGRFYIYPLVVLFFVLFMICLIMSLHTKNRHWLFALSSIAVIQGISKPFLYVNDIAFFLLFPVVYAIEQKELTTKLPFIKIKINTQLLKDAIAPSLLYFAGIIAFEYLHGVMTKSHFFLSDLFLPQSPTSKDAILSQSLHFKGGFIQQLENIVSLILYSFHLLLTSITGSVYMLVFACLSLVISTKKPVQWLVSSLAIIFSASFIVYKGIYAFMYPNVFVPLPPYTFWEIIGLALFVWFLVLIILRTKHGLALVLSHIFYLGALAMSLGAVHQMQLFVTIIFWFVLLIAYAINSVWSQVLASMARRVYLTTIGIVLALFIIPVYGYVQTSVELVQQRGSEVQYLEWVKTVVPEDDYILGGANDSLPLISIQTNREVIYNAFYVASNFPPQADYKEVYQYLPLADYIAEQATTSSKPRFYVLDNDIETWSTYLEKGTSSTYPPNMYELDEAAYNESLNRKIYTLQLRSQSEN